jgi:AraC-like DNA-binding protein
MRRDDATGDFASAAMLRVLAAGLRALGLRVPRPPAGAAASGARVPLDAKRALVEAAVAQGGLACLPRLGAGVRAGTHDPVHRALVSACDGADLIARWRRLERYIHSRHRTEAVAVATGRAVLRHVSTAAGEAPSAAEDLVVLGVICALLAAVGAEDVRATLDGVPVVPEADETALRRLAARGGTATWTLAWRDPPPRPLRRGPAGRRRTEPRVPADLCDALDWPPPARRVAARLLADPLAPRTVDAAARALGTSRRSLQRTLAADGLTWSELVAQTRLRVAGWWLIETDRPIAEIGFLAGYADQPHFTREFGRRIGLAPGRYREQFGRGR